MKQLINRFIKAIDGKKTFIGIAMHTTWFIANMAFKDLSTPTEAVTGHAIIGSITGIGLGHKIAKNKEKISQQINKLKK